MFNKHVMDAWPVPSPCPGPGGSSSSVRHSGQGFDVRSYLTTSAHVKEVIFKPVHILGGVGVSAMHWMSVSPPKFMCWILTPKGNGVRRWGFWEVMRSWGWTPTTGLVSYKGDPRELLCFLQVRTQQEDPVYEPGGGFSPETESAGTLILDSQPPEL